MKEQTKSMLLAADKKMIEKLYAALSLELQEDEVLLCMESLIKIMS